MTASLAAAALAFTGVVAFAPPATAAAGDLLISEYVEGGSNNKAIEVYNPTDAAVDLAAANYTLKVYSNGSATAGQTVALTGSVGPGDVHVVVQSQAVAGLLAIADQVTTSSLFNGNDAVALVKADTAVDVFGQIGVNPGDPGWGAGTPNATTNRTLQRAADVCVGDPNGGDAFDPAAGWTGLAQDTFTGLGAHTANCGDVPPPAAKVVINEFSADTTGATDVEYVELLADPATTDLSGYRVLEIEGDVSGTVTGTVDEVIAFPAADASGRSLATLTNGALENGTVSLLLITGTAPALGTDIDTNDDGVIDDGLGFTVVDAIAVRDAASDLTYGGTTLEVSYDGFSFDPGGASRIPDGKDTGTAADWLRNDFELAGYNGTAGTPQFKEAYNTPGAANAAVPPPPPIEAGCDLETASIASVQGSGAASPRDGQSLRLEGVVTGDFQGADGFDGFYIQDAGDGDPATSDGIFVFYKDAPDVSVGDVVNVAGKVKEFSGLTELEAIDLEVCATGQSLPEPVELTLPATEQQREALEGMYVTLPQQLTIGETFDFARFGTISLTVGRQYQPTHLFDAGSVQAEALKAKNALESIGVDDGRGVQNPDPALHPNGDEFTLENTFRSGDTLTDVTGVLDWRFLTWGVQQTEDAEFAEGNPRPDVPEVGGDLKVASFNVLNYFTTLTGADARGANDQAEFDRQEAKIVTALAEIDADVFGLIEIENDEESFPLETLTAALNERLGSDVYDYIETGLIGTDVITTALMYKPASVTPVGDFQLMDEEKDERWLDDFNRPGLTQTFADNAGATFTVVVNHLKSKGSVCDAVDDPEDPDGQGNCNGVRTAAASALADWLATDPTGQGTVGRELILGDLNSYAQEDPIQVLTGAGYTDLEAKFHGTEAYSYVFDGMLGYLDYALSGSDLLDEVTGASAWNINADEPSLIDYDMSFKKPAQDALYAEDEFRSSDHDPVVVGLQLTPPDTTPPTIQATADPSFILAPNNKDRDVTVSIEAEDDRGEVTVDLTSVTTNGKPRAAWTEIDDTHFTVKAANGAIYTFTYTATDAAGNTATDTATVVVGMKGLLELQ
ncbi:ExeM/NucH family extracellular endonuclease [Microbacterium sp. HJ5]